MKAFVLFMLIIMFCFEGKDIMNQNTSDQQLGAKLHVLGGFARTSIRYNPLRLSNQVKVDMGSV